MTAEQTVSARGPIDCAADLREWIVADAQAPGGAFYSWLDASTGEPAYEYPEITGYALTHLAGLAHPTDVEVESGFRAGRWLVDRTKAGDLGARPGWDQAVPYVFDLAMISTGLLRFGRRFNASEMAAAAMSLTRPMAESVLDGSFRSIQGRLDSSRTPAWSTDGSAHLLKVLQALLLAARCGADDADYAVAASTLAGTASWLQKDDGRFVTFPDDIVTMLHPHLYAVEGLWMYAEATGDKESRERARRAAEWAWAQQLPNGGFPRHATARVSASSAPEQCDVTAQAIRAAVILGLEPSRLSDAVDRLVSAAVTTNTGRVALRYQPAADPVHANTWVSLFAHQALKLAGGASIAWKDLV